MFLLCRETRQYSHPWNLRRPNPPTWRTLSYRLAAEGLSERSLVSWPVPWFPPPWEPAVCSPEVEAFLLPPPPLLRRVDTTPIRTVNLLKATKIHNYESATGYMQHHGTTWEEAAWFCSFLKTERLLFSRSGSVLLWFVFFCVVRPGLTSVFG